MSIFEFGNLHSEYTNILKTVFRCYESPEVQSYIRLSGHVRGITGHMHGHMRGIYRYFTCAL